MQNSKLLVISLFHSLFLCVFVLRHVLRGCVSLAVHVSSEQSVRQDPVSVLGAALQAAARRSGHSRQPGGGVERRGGESKPDRFPSHLFTPLSPAGFDHRKADVFVLQVFRFVQNLIGCEEQARVFKDEVRAPSVCELNVRFVPTFAVDKSKCTQRWEQWEHQSVTSLSVESFYLSLFDLLTDDPVFDSTFAQLLFRVHNCLRPKELSGTTMVNWTKLTLTIRHMIRNEHRVELTPNLTRVRRPLVYLRGCCILL